jgi:hypothetical protein
LDGGPKVGEGSPALAPQVGGLPVSDAIDLKSRYDGQVSGPDVLRVFFGGSAAPFDHQNEAEVASKAKAAFEAWGGPERLAKCLAEVPRPQGLCEPRSSGWRAVNQRFRTTAIVRCDLRGLRPGAVTVDWRLSGQLVR